MSDVRCPKCGEPWDLDCLHEEAAARLYDRGEEPEQTRYGASWGEERYRPVFNEVRADFYARGYEALTSYGARHNDTEADPRIALAYELLGDDIDGAVAELEDML